MEPAQPRDGSQDRSRSGDRAALARPRGGVGAEVDAAAGPIPEPVALTALRELAALPIMRVAPGPLLARCWELRDNLTVYDAAYVALAETTGATLLTSDRRLAGAPGVRCEVELLR